MPVNGKREWALGMFNSLKVFPLRDSRGHCYGAVSFESAAPDDIIIAQSLELLCNLRQDVSNNSNYQRLRPSDGIMVVDANRVIVAANTVHVICLMLWIFLILSAAVPTMLL